MLAAVHAILLLAAAASVQWQSAIAMEELKYQDKPRDGHVQERPSFSVHYPREETTTYTDGVEHPNTVYQGTGTGDDGAEWSALRTHYPGDILLAAFFPIHKFNQGGKLWPSANHADSCGRIQPEDGIQMLEAFFLALDTINESGMLPGFTLGAVVIDSCDDETHALEQAVELIRVLMARGGVQDMPITCSNGEAPQVAIRIRELLKVVGVIGGRSSGVTIQLASLLKLFFIPQVSYLSTSAELSNVEKYPYFKRTVPSDTHQARAILAILRELSFSYVSVVYEDTNYGRKGFAELERLAPVYDVCLAMARRLETDGGLWGYNQYNLAVKDLLAKERARVVILYMDFPHVRNMFRAVRHLKASGVFTFVGSDAWSGRQIAVAGYEDVAVNSITLQPLAYNIPQFDDYFFKLHPDTNERNPWFAEFWESHFNCRLPAPQYIKWPMLNVNAMEPCTGEESISPINHGYHQQEYLHFVWDAVFAFAHALRAMQRDLCGPDHQGLCDDITPYNISGPKLLKYLEHVYFPGASGEQFSFWNGNEGPGRYTLMHYGGNDEQLSWKKIYNFSIDEDTDTTSILSFGDKLLELLPSYPASYCSEPCSLGQAQQSVPGDRCCWICANCSDYAIVSPSMYDAICVECRYGWLPNEHRNACQHIPETFMSYNHPYAISCEIFAVAGLMLTLFTVAVVLVNLNTPVIKASGREISLYLLVSILISYLSTFIIVSKPCTAICGLSNLLVGLCFTMVYAAILTKTNRISRIFSGSLSPQKARLTSPKSQLVIVNMLVLVEVMIVGAWLVAEHPDTINVYPQREDSIVVCLGAEGPTFFISLVYPFFLLFICIIYGFKTRKTPDGFNETKLIGFSSYTTCVIWLAFMPSYTLQADRFIRTAVISVALNLNATVALLCIFSPKVYVCLFRPSKNTREAVMMRSESVISSGSAMVMADTDRVRTSSSATALTMLYNHRRSLSNGCLSHRSSAIPNGSSGPGVSRPALSISAPTLFAYPEIKESHFLETFDTGTPRSRKGSIRHSIAFEMTVAGMPEDVGSGHLKMEDTEIMHSAGFNVGEGINVTIEQLDMETEDHSCTF